MRLSGPTHARVERFLRWHLRRDDLVLPPVRLYSGPFIGWLTALGRIGAITFGRRIFVSPKFLERDAEGRLSAPGWLVAHECVHVLQYEARGYVRFLLSYVLSYLRALVKARACGAGARAAAYRGLREEVEARMAEIAYQNRGHGGAAWEGTVSGEARRGGEGGGITALPPPG